jgi:hypothetical protein
VFMGTLMDTPRNRAHARLEKWTVPSGKRSRIDSVSPTHLACISIARGAKTGALFAYSTRLLLFDMMRTRTCRCSKQLWQGKPFGVRTRGYCFARKKVARFVKASAGTTWMKFVGTRVNAGCQATGGFRFVVDSMV